MKTHVEYLIRRCALCNQYKPSNTNLGFYEPLLVSLCPRESISLNLISDFPTTLSKHDLHHPFEETNASYYVVGIVFTQGGDIIAYQFGTI
jgi:hypothetical protein